MSLNQYLREAARQKRMQNLLNAKHLAPYTRRHETGAQRMSRERAEAENRNKALPRYDFAATKWIRICHPKVS